jgi:hypothetical protein
MDRELAMPRGPTPREAGRGRRSAIAQLRVRGAALVTGGSVAGFVAVHAVHAAAVGAPVVVGFVCNVMR